MKKGNTKQTFCVYLTPASIAKLRAMVENDKVRLSGDPMAKVNQSTLIEALIMREASKREANND